MQCSSCQFENMPGTEICGRCGTSMRLGTAMIDVHPPRAAGWKKRLRRALPVSRAFYAVDNGLQRVTSLSLIARATWLPGVADFFRLAIPGWPQQHYGRRLLAWLLLGTYLSLLLGAFLSIGSAWSGVLVGLAFAVHSAGVFHATSGDVMNGGTAARILRSALVSITLAALIYVPVAVGLSRLANPITMEVAAPPLASGDVLLVQDVWTPQVGHVVEYDLAPLHVQTAPHAYAYIGGRRIDRILAGGGSHVLWDHGQLYVNGAQSLLLPLNPAAAPTRLEVTVPPNCFLIMPTAIPQVGPQLPADAWQTVSVVPAGSIRGTVYFRQRPFSRWGFVR